MRARTIIFGGGGHAKVVIESLRRTSPEIELVAIDDDPSKNGQLLLGVMVVGARDWLRANWPDAPVALALGGNGHRLAAADWLRQENRVLQTVIDPSATVSESASIGEGTFLAPGCVVNAEAAIGRAVIVNTSASIDHDCRIGAGVHVAPGAHLCGGVTICERALIGAGATIIPGIAVGADAVVAAGATVVRDVSEAACVAGTPARPR